MCQPLGLVMWRGLAPLDQGASPSGGHRGEPNHHPAQEDPQAPPHHATTRRPHTAQRLTMAVRREDVAFFITLVIAGGCLGMLWLELNP